MGAKRYRKRSPEDARPPSADVELRSSAADPGGALRLACARAVVDPELISSRNTNLHTNTSGAETLFMASGSRFSS